MTLFQKKTLLRILAHAKVGNKVGTWVGKIINSKPTKWRDVAEFERKELLKVRVYRSLRQASTALLITAVITIIFRKYQ
jgi:hypothetical protein